ncbi:NUMOD4 domain-containing protein [Bacillus sp. AFS029533]|uniref:NUMOD4 domain-containing protein n=1 Tax=Bacillus sp. AFS029533 TaxID=2033494 RepID=UPI0015D4D73C|nr:NUMOD4 domain-containing protein [Bacillus sp. AFS029533]
MTVKEFIQGKGKEYFINQTSPEIYKKYQEWSVIKELEVCSKQILKRTIQNEFDLSVKPVCIHGKTMRVYTDIPNRPANNVPLFIEGEEWETINGFESYQVSTLGRVKGKNMIIKPSDNGLGYLQVGLRKNNESKFVLIHRLVAQAFISNPHNQPCVHHFNGDRTCNYVGNLSWVSHEQKSYYANSYQKLFKDKKLVFEDNQFILKNKNI